MKIVRKLMALTLVLVFLLSVLINKNDYVHAAPIGTAEEIKEGTNYIMYIDDKANTLFDDDGRQEGWLRYEEFSWQNKHSFQFENAGDGKYYIKNVGTGYYIKSELKKLPNGNSYVVSGKSGTEDKMKFVLEKDGDKFLLKAEQLSLYVTKGQHANYATYVADKSLASRFTIEQTPPTPPYPYPEESTTLWKNPDGNNYYRIPAIATTNTGRVIAVADYRYNHGSDLGNHKIDLLVKYTDNPDGTEWSESKNITAFNNDSSVGYGDAAIVADRESNKVLILAAFGTQGYWHGNPQYVSTRQNPIKVARFISDDNGENFSAPEDLTAQIYGLDDRFQRLFVASGRIIQSRYIKVGEYYRIYTTILEGATGGNYVLYSDDFGKTWNMLGDNNSPVPGGDEAKVEELPNGSIVISSRTGTGRYINIFTFDDADKTYKTGQWSTKKKLTLGNGSSTNGEVMVLHVKDNEKNKYTYLVLQSLPTLNGSRNGVGIYYKELKYNTETVDEYLTNWSESQFLMVQKRSSAYSTMTTLPDGRIGFLYEDRAVGYGYDIQYYPVSLETITNGRYSAAFVGIGSKDTPYLINDEEALQARQSIYKNENVNFKSLLEEKETSTDSSAQTDDTKVKFVGWIKYNNKWYYLDENGEPKKGWIIDEDKKYYLDKDGVMATGWIFDDGKWYYLKENGSMATGWIFDDASWYYLKENGSMATGWIFDNGKWYYLKENGSMATGWLFDDGKWYFLEKNGAMFIGWMFDGYNWFYLKENGSMQTGWMFWEGKWYYLRPNGVMERGWLKWEDKWYYLRPSGAMEIGWFKYKGEYYHFDNSGAMETGWIKYNDSWYYLKDNGAAAKGWIKISGRWYYLTLNI